MKAYMEIGLAVMADCEFGNGAFSDEDLEMLYYPFTKKEFVNLKRDFKEEGQAAAEEFGTRLVYVTLEGYGLSLNGTMDPKNKWERELLDTLNKKCTPLLEGCEMDSRVLKKLNKVISQVLEEKRDWIREQDKQYGHNRDGWAYTWMSGAPDFFASITV